MCVVGGRDSENNRSGRGSATTANSDRAEGWRAHKEFVGTGFRVHADGAENEPGTQFTIVCN